MKAVRFDEYGGIEVLQVLEVARPQPGPGQVLVRTRRKMRAADPWIGHH
jgi:NADPH:quinone reductase-like Zn-dependent oxidoreductase